MKKIKKEYYLIAILLIMFILLTIFVASNKTLNIDEAMFNKIISIKNKPLSYILFTFTTIGSTAGVFVVLFITAILFLKQKKFSDFKYVLINVATGVILMSVIKNIIGRVRPSWKWITQGGFSYPSGHTISAVLLYGTLILLIQKRLNGKVKRPLMLIFVIMILLIAISRIYFGVHYLTDVLAAIILGTIILIISNLFMNKEFNNDKDKVRKTIQTR